MLVEVVEILGSFIDFFFSKHRDLSTCFLRTSYVVLSILFVVK
jgi:hypothetical protein